MRAAINLNQLEERLEKMRGDLEAAAAKHGSLIHPCVVAYSRRLDAALNEYHQCGQRVGDTA